MGALCFLSFPLFAAIERPALPDQTLPGGKGELSFQSLLDRLSILNEPVSREGTGRLTARAPGEYYRFQFRLIARGPEALRLELFDLFGRPVLYLISYLGETRIFSLAQNKEIPLRQSLPGPWSPVSQMPIIEIMKLFWGRVPLFPSESYQIKTGEERGKEFIKILFEGPMHQELWITPYPFSLTKSRIKNQKNEGELEILFTDFSSIAGSQIPLQMEIKEGQSENVLTLRYETLILRPDIPEDTFKIPDLPPSPPADNS